MAGLFKIRCLIEDLLYKLNELTVTSMGGCHSIVPSLLNNTHTTLFPFSLALLVTDEQHEAVRNQRKIEVQQRQQLFLWGDDPIYTNLPGYLKFETKTLPKDVQFTQEGIDELHKARRKALANLGLVTLLDIFDSWDDFDDYRKVRLFLYCLIEKVKKQTRTNHRWKMQSCAGSLISFIR